MSDRCTAPYCYGYRSAATSVGEAHGLCTWHDSLVRQGHYDPVMKKYDFPKHDNALGLSKTNS